jgi:hypothetical protein
MSHCVLIRLFLTCRPTSSIHCVAHRFASAVSALRSSQCTSIVQTVQTSVVWLCLCAMLYSFKVMGGRCAVIAYCACRKAIMWSITSKSVPTIRVWQWQVVRLLATHVCSVLRAIPRRAIPRRVQNSRLYTACTTCSSTPQVQVTAVYGRRARYLRCSAQKRYPLRPSPWRGSAGSWRRTAQRAAARSSGARRGTASGRA